MRPAEKFLYQTKKEGLQEFSSLDGLVEYVKKEEKETSPGPSLREKVLQIAEKERLTGGENKETQGSNHGPLVDKYLAYVGLGPGQPWCAAFVAWCIDQAGGNCPKTGDTWALEDWGRKEGIWNPKTLPEVGDIFLLYGKNNRPTHTGFVTKVCAGYVETIEGNTSPDGSPEGIGIFKRERDIPDIEVIKWWKL